MVAPQSDLHASASFIFHLHRSEQIRVTAQFRMGSHWLNSEKHRLVAGVFIPRSQRLCACCHFNSREDEMHLLECPFYNDIRLRFQTLFCSDQDPGLMTWNMQVSDADMRTFMNGSTREFWNDLANFLLACRKKRQVFLDTLTV